MVCPSFRLASVIGDQEIGSSSRGRVAAHSILAIITTPLASIVHHENLKYNQLVCTHGIHMFAYDSNAVYRDNDRIATTECFTDLSKLN